MLRHRLPCNLVVRDPRDNGRSLGESERLGPTRSAADRLSPRAFAPGDLSLRFPALTALPAPISLGARPNAGYECAPITDGSQREHDVARGVERSATECRFARYRPSSGAHVRPLRFKPSCYRGGEGLAPSFDVPRCRLCPRERSSVRGERAYPAAEPRRSPKSPG